MDPTATFVPKLPPELWLHIFRFATSTPTPLSSHYEPFQSCHDSTVISDAALSDKRSISLVCKQWHNLARGSILYEDIRIGSGIPALHTALDTPDSDGYLAPRYHARPAGTGAPRAPPTTGSARPTTHAPALRTQRHIRLFNRRASSTTRPPPTRMGLRQNGRRPTHRRHQRTRRRPARRADSARISCSRAPCPTPHCASSPCACTRSARSASRTAPRRVRSSRARSAIGPFPALDTLVLCGPARAEALEPLVEAFAGQVRVLELGPGVPPLEACKIVGAFPALEELNVLVGGAGGVLRACVHETLQCVGVGVDAEEWDGETWSVVVEHVEKFVEGCPALRDVVLYARDVRVAEDNPQFQALRKTLHESSSLQPQNVPPSREAPIQSAPLFVSKDTLDPTHILWADAEIPYSQNI
ncbi:hypothetical protein H4582DRAFT_2070354 [Lactarius indigo]|nr:hypothetical protein H4582DRAFT_2070354 [Lactarius indigo]